MESKTFIYPIEKKFYDSFSKGKFICSYDKKQLMKGDQLLFYRKGNGAGFVGYAKIDKELSTIQKKKKSNWTFTDPNMNRYMYKTIEFKLFDPVKLNTVFNVIHEDNKKGFKSDKSFLYHYVKNNAWFVLIDNDKFKLLKDEIESHIEKESDSDSDDNNEEENDNDDNSESEEENKKEHIKIMEESEDDTDEEIEEKEFKEKKIDYSKRGLRGFIPIMLVPNPEYKIPKTPLSYKKKILIKRFLTNQWNVTNNNDIDPSHFILKSKNIKLIVINDDTSREFNKALECYNCCEEYKFKTKESNSFKIYQINNHDDLYHGCFLVCATIHPKILAETITSTNLSII